LFDLLKLPRIQGHSNRVLGSSKNFVNPRLRATVRAAFGHFIAKMRSLEGGREDGKETREWSAGCGVRHREGSSEREEEVGR
jgi:hypothetical protein